MIRRPPRSPLFPYPPLFRSAARRDRFWLAGLLGGLAAATRSAGVLLLVALALLYLYGPRGRPASARRSEEHTSELQSRQYLVCRLLLEKKKNTLHPPIHHMS